VPAPSLRNGKEDVELINCIYSLQCPSSSPWKKPFIRVVSNHQYSRSEKVLKVRMFVYFTRLIFELIADPSIMAVLARIEGQPVAVVRCQKQKPRPTLFCSSNSELYSKSAYKYSLPGILKRAENQGYPLAESQPPGLNVRLFDYQKSSYQWMLDQERNERGINSFFWEEWKYSDGGGSMFYFPLAGEFRLTQVPKSNGGLLCEEMGLGKKCFSF
jgi:hypothetical protein